MSYDLKVSLGSVFLPLREKKTGTESAAGAGV